MIISTGKFSKLQVLEALRISLSVSWFNDNLTREEFLQLVNNHLKDQISKAKAESRAEMKEEIKNRIENDPEMTGDNDDRSNLINTIYQELDSNPSP